MNGPRYTFQRYRDDTWNDAVARREGRGAARDPWCITKLLHMGEITASQHGAAVRLSGLMERGQGAASGTMERVDRAGGDPHARLWDVSICAQEAECALAYVRTQLAGEKGAAMRICALDAALSFPHRSISAAQRDAGLGYGGAGRAMFVRCLIDGLELLITHWDSVDAQAERQRRRGR